MCKDALESVRKGNVNRDRDNPYRVSSLAQTSTIASTKAYLHRISGIACFSRSL